MNDRTTPHDLEAEKAVLGALMVNQSQLGVVSSVLADADFFRDAHRRIYTGIRRLVEQGVGVDLLTVKSHLRDTGELDECGGPSYIASLTDGVARSSNAGHYAAIVREKARLRQVISACSEAMGRAYDMDISAAELIESGMKALSGITLSRKSGTVRMDEAVARYQASVADGTVMVPVPTGYADLDKLVHGMRPRDLVIVAARPSVGKTALMQGIADYMSSHNHAVGIVSLEVDIERLAAQYLSWRSGVPSGMVESGDATDADYGRVNDACSALGVVPIHIETSAYTLTEIWDTSRRLKAEHGVKAVFVDYLQLMVLGQKSESREREVAAISRGLKLMAKELDILVVALSQLGRAPETRRDKRPLLSDLRESGALEQDADLVLLLFRAEMYGRKDDNEGIAEVIVAKNRHGPTGVVRLAFQKELARFHNLYVGG